MFYRQQSDQYIQEGTQFEIDGVTYPPQWLNQSTPEQKAELGLVEVVATNQPANMEYYWVSETLNGALLTYTNTPKDLDTVKSNSNSQVRSIAYSILFPTDWMVVKAFETSTPVPSDWNTWRESIRTTAANTIAAVEAAKDVEEVEAIMSNIAWQPAPNSVVLENTI